MYIPMSNQRRARTQFFIALLVMSLLFAQALGLVHAIAHANWQGSSVHSQINEALFDEGHPAAVAHHADDGSDHASAHGGRHHSCEAYDGATLAAMMHFDFPAMPLLPPMRVLALWQAFASWDAPVNCPFLSRAPPR
ncbi:hypothetical protein [Herbaspirillum sp. alder98]|uniref:hypothetical protein n=1 Tax=Herbaspirillum sp. alder98 TaxID=2913096 RepID=UPI001CD8CC3E|nr:hypothetical protein [Herbaspirillum sp. alder98]MCA1325685.1 hypothetical protein [Herbaspirillum sp. alder98]